jgi:hypothetical protein
LNLGIEAALLARCRSLVGWRLYILHDLFHVSPGVKSLSPQEFLNFKAVRRRANAIPGEKFPTIGNFSRARE